jgi:protoporphyrinogen oxidase
MDGDAPVVVVGAGPAGLAAALALARRGRRALVLEASAAVGGLSRTYERGGHRFDLGGHRFFTRNAEVQALWRDLLGEEFLRRDRLSRIYYRNHLFHYPLRPANALFGLGVGTSLRALASLAAVRLRPALPERTFADWVSNRFGRVLYEAFFRTYTEKVWGIPHDRLSADWAAQRIRNLSLRRAVLDAFGIGKRGSVASLIDAFDYPRLGPGQMYERMAGEIGALGSEIRLGHRLVAVHTDSGRVAAVVAEADGRRIDLAASAVISSVPLPELVRRVTPAAPGDVLAAASGLRFRAILAVNLVVRRATLAPDTWIYLHSPDVRAARLQLFRNWSPQMAGDPGASPVGLEYFCDAGDAFWSLADEELVAIGRRDLERLAFARGAPVEGGFVVRWADAYPIYEDGYAGKVQALRRWLAGIEGLQTIGRGGQFRYNNMDHAILTGLLAARRLLGEDVDPWSVNEEAQYVE